MTDFSFAYSHDWKNADGVTKLKRLREEVNMTNQRDHFLLSLRPIIHCWSGPVPNLRDIFQAEEINWLLAESVNNFIDLKLPVRIGIPLIDFVIRTGYKDEPEVDEDGRLLLHRITAVHYAATQDKHEFIDKLFQSTVRQDPNCRSQESSANSIYSPLQLALAGGHEYVAELLLLNGADPNLTNADESTPLHIICMRRNDDGLANTFFRITDEIDQQVPVNVRDKSGWTPLLLAVANLLPNVVDVLFDRGWCIGYEP
uniref:Uncharacterized protein n=1 Tax=Trichogramma kaykai TaxID=54128 RepID=A0ABD2WKG3_9HYME